MSSTLNLLTADQRRQLTQQIAALLQANSNTTRGFYDMRGKALPDGPNIMGKLLKRYPLDGVRAEIGGTTLSVEITTERQGEQPEPTGEGMRYATSNYEEFRDWFYAMLKRSGIEPKAPKLATSIVQSSKRPVTIKADLRKPPYITNRKSCR